MILPPFKKALSLLSVAPRIPAAAALFTPILLVALLMLVTKLSACGPAMLPGYVRSAGMTSAIRSDRSSSPAASIS